MFWVLKGRFIKEVGYVSFRLSVYKPAFQRKHSSTLTESICFKTGGYEKLSVKALPLEKLSSKYNYVKNGQFHPYHCTAVQKIAIIVPYRTRERQLIIFLNNIIPKLYRQHLDFTVFVIEL
ncbi:hypothetical protein KUTeg_006466, partial [Tegillarca granosa]